MYKPLVDDFASTNDGTPDTQIFLTSSILNILHHSHRSPKTDIQIFTNFTLQPEMDIQIFQNFAFPPTLGHSSTSKKRAADEAPDFEPPYKKYQRKRNKMNPEKIKQGVEVLVERYQLDEVQKANLESVAKLTHFVPSVEQVEWLVTEARLREDCSHELNYYMFAYMEFFPWFLAIEGRNFRLLISELDRSSRQLWVGFCDTSVTEVLHIYTRHNKMDNRLSLNWYCGTVTWIASFKHLFQLDEILPKYRSEMRYRRLCKVQRLRLAERLQIEYFRAIMKVLARFPGLVRKRDYPRGLRHHQLYEEWSAQPFRYKEKSSESNPLSELFKTLCTKKTGKAERAKSQERREERDGQDNDGNEDGEGHGDGLGVEAGDGAGVEAENGAGMSL
jgi:hypothetical protein